MLLICWSRPFFCWARVRCQASKPNDSRRRRWLSYDDDDSDVVTAWLLLALFCLLWISSITRREYFYRRRLVQHHNEMITNFRVENAGARVTRAIAGGFIIFSSIHGEMDRAPCIILSALIKRGDRDRIARKRESLWPKRQINSRRDSRRVSRVRLNRVERKIQAATNRYTIQVIFDLY